jgi:endonuclease/exonuclease/phosphatase (EEP) superfamily protein YafD
MPQKKIPHFKKLLNKNGYDYKYAPSYTRKETTYGELTAYKKSEMSLDFVKVVDLGSSIVARIISRHNSKYTSLLTVFKFEKKDFIVINIHLMPQALHGRRRKQLGIAIEALQLLKFVNIPSLIVGDYNYSSLIGRGGLVRFMAKHGFVIANKKKIITHKKWRIPHQTDYVFAKKCKITRIKSDRINFSDHYPLFVDFTI